MAPKRQRIAEDSEDGKDIQNNNANATIGQETDPVLRVFGHPSEGFQIIGDVGVEILRSLRDRYRLRRQLANWAQFPEGYEFMHAVAGGPPRAIVLLTPPDQVAVRREDGTWIRRPRNEEEDGPEPYTMEWYLAYLRAHDLPLWFLRPEHLACVDNDAEAKFLGYNNSSSRVLPPTHYLEMRYPEVPLYPGPDIYSNGEAYALNITETQLRRLARRFPATMANANAGGYRIFVLPSGHIVIRHRRTKHRERLADAAWVDWQPETALNMRASYRVEGVTTPPTITRPASRHVERQTMRDAGPMVRMVDLDQVPHGLGTWGWLNPAVDLQLARAFGLNTPLEVATARQNGMLAGMPVDARPMTVFTPNARYLNPTRQPAGPGQWEYLTTEGDNSSQALAWLNFGGLPGVFPTDRTPSAAAIMWYRQAYHARLAAGEYDDDPYAEDPTGEVDLVWVPRDDDDVDMDDQEEVSDDEEETGVGIDAVDPHTGLPHDPRNRGINDQTGVVGHTHYYTRNINGQNYTLDRARARAGTVEPHKSWVLTKKGHWQQWTRYASLDWNDASQIERMNKWREQAATRNGWATKREVVRPDYTEAQRRWMFEYVKSAAGERPANMTMEALASTFNTTFGERRRVIGVTGLYDRLRREWKENGGKLGVGLGRGHNKKAEAEERKRRLSMKVESEEEEVEEEEGEEEEEEEEEE